MVATNDDLLKVLQDIDKKLFVLINCQDADEAINLSEDRKMRGK